MFAIDLMSRLHIVVLRCYMFLSCRKGACILKEKDIVEKSLEDYDDVFADIVNGLLFEGENTIDPDGLVEQHPASYYRSHGKGINTLERDVLKSWHQNLINVAVIGIENQSTAHPYMPIRVIGYDGSAYRKQLADYDAAVRRSTRNISQKNEQNISLPEFRPVPVVTLVLYFGNQHWKKDRRLKDLINIPAKLKPYVNDYKINVFEIAWLTDEEIKRFKSDFRIVANFFAKRRKNPNYVPDDMTEMIHPDEVLSLIASASGDERYFHVIEANEKGKVKNMCEVADRLWNGGREEGIKEGEKRGEKRGIIKILRDLVDDGTLSITEAAKRSGMNVAAFKAAIKNI